MTSVNIKTNNSVVLYYPRLEPERKSKVGIWEPLSLLAIAGPLEAAGYDVHIIDGRIRKKSKDDILETANNIICFGISAMAGYQVCDGLKMAKFLKHHFPKIPIIWGGWHSSTLSDQTIRSAYVDIIVRGQGEETLKEIVDKLLSGQPLTEVLGIAYKEDGKVISNPDRPLQDLNNFPILPYHLLDASHYSLNEGILHYYSSQGCPWNCGFCGVDVIFKGRYISLKPQRIVSDLKFLMEKYYIKRVNFYDSNFVFGKERTRKICKEICEAKLNIKWEAAGRIDQIARFDEDLLNLMTDSGCERISIGVESGSQKMLNFINKNLKIKDIIKGTNLLKSHGISVMANYIIGLPEESWDDFKLTLKLIRKLNVLPVIHQYTPVPGSPLYEMELEKGIVKNQNSLEEWADSYKMMRVKKPWLYKNDALKRQAAIFYFRIAYVPSGFGYKLRKIHLGFLYRLYQKIAMLRLHWNYFSLSIDWQIYKLAYKIMVKAYEFKRKW